MFRCLFNMLINKKLVYWFIAVFGFFRLNNIIDAQLIAKWKHPTWPSAFFLCLFGFFTKITCKKNDKKGIPTYQEFSDTINNTIHYLEDKFTDFGYVSYGDPYATKPTICNAHSCGGCSDQPFENMNNCIRWCKAPCLCRSPASGRGDDIMCSKVRRKRANCGTNYSSKSMCETDARNFGYGLMCVQYKAGCWKMMKNFPKKKN